MATEVTYSEVQCYVETYNSYQTKRTALLNLSVQTNRYITFNYKQILFSKKDVYVQVNPVGNEREAVSGKGVPQIIETSDGYVYLDYFTYSNNRIGYTEKGLPGSNIRYATFIPNASKVISSTQVILPFRYSSDRTALIGYTNSTQRHAQFILQEKSERNIFVQKFRELKLKSIRTIESILKHSDRRIYVETLNRISNRIVNLTIGTSDYRYAFAQNYSKATLNTTQIIETLTGFNSEITAFLLTSPTFSERYAYIQRLPDSTRYATFTLGLSSDRTGTYLTNQLKLLHDTYIVQCHPYYSERFGVTKGYQHFTERISLYGTGEYYKVRKVYAKSPDILPISKYQDKATFGFVSTPSIDNIHSDSGAIAKVTENKDILKVVGLSQSDKSHVSTVDSFSGSAISDSVERKIKILTYGKFIANIGVKYTDKRYTYTLGGYRWEEILGITSGYIVEVSESTGIVTPYNYTDRYSFATPYNYTDRTAITTPYNYTDRDVVLEYILYDNSERDAITIGKSSDALVQDADGNVYELYVNNNELRYKPTDKDYSPTYVKDEDDNTYKIILDEDNELGIVREDADMSEPPVVKDSEGNEYELYVENNTLKFRPKNN